MAVSDKQTEERIFEAATDIFVEKGMDGARMQDIANRAGINKAMLHYYFRSKDHLFNAVFEKVAAKMFEKFSPVLDEELSLQDKIRFFYREHITFLQNNQQLPAFILNEINRNPERIKRLLKNLELDKLWMMILEKHGEELKDFNITPDLMPQIMVSIASLSVFPFAARGILEALFEKTNVDFDKFMEERKTFAADFVIRALKK